MANSFSDSLPILTRLAEDYKTNKVDSVFMKEANLIDLTEAMGSVLSKLNTTDETVPPQAKYNKIVVSAFENRNFFNFMKIMNRICDFYDADFAFCTVSVPLGRFPRPSREKFLEFKQLYVFDSNMDLRLGEVFPIELIRAIRLHLTNLLFRFFKTNNVHETFVTRDGKTQNVCEPCAASYRLNGRTVANEKFLNFIEYLIEANELVKCFTPELSEFSNAFREAAKIARAERDSFRTRQKQSIPSQQREQEQEQEHTHLKIVKKHVHNARNRFGGRTVAKST